MAEIANLAVLDANNTARFPEGQLVPTLNDGGRALEGILARWEKDTNGSIASSGSVNAFAILTNRVIPSHAAGNEFKFRATTANTGASTITINALASKPLRRHGGSALQSGDIGTNQLVHVLYNSAGDYYECLGVSGGGGGDSLPSGGTTGQVLAKASNDDGDVEWTTAEGTGDMLASMYDPEGVEADAFAMDNMADGSSKVAMTTSERSKLSGIASGATANSSNATLLARSNHTGTQAISTVDGLQTALDGKASTSHGIHVPTGGSTGQVLKKASGSDGDLEWAADNTGGGGGGLDNLVDDTTPQLGGDLDLNGHVITGMVIGTNVQAYSANLAEWSGINPSSNGGSLVAAADYAAMRALLDLEAGTDFLSPSAIEAAYQPIDSDLTAIATLSPSNDDIVQRKSGVWINRTMAQLVADIAAAGAALREPGVVTDATTSKTLALTDAGKIVEMTSGSANDVVIPANASVAFPVGTIINIVQQGAGTTTIDADTGVTLNGVSGGEGAISARYGGVSIYKRATNEWVMSGAHGAVA